MKWQKYHLLIVMSLFFIIACGGDEKPDDTDSPVTVKSVTVPSFEFIEEKACAVLSCADITNSYLDI